jgi:hypothetical protein
MFTRHYIAAQSIEPGDIVLEANAAEPSRIYADRALGSYEHDGWVYVPTNSSRYRFDWDQQVTVLRGL